jgi:hypothetical protein
MNRCVFALIIGAVWTVLATNEAPAQQTIGVHCRVKPVRTNALDFPSKHAWDLFISLNHPAIDRKIARGEPDCSLPIGTPGTTAVWETWRNAETEVYLEKGAEPPDWNDNSLPDAPPATVPQFSISSTEMKALAAKERMQFLSFHDFGTRTIKPKFSPEDGVFKGEGGFGETRMNRWTYDFIKRNCLWSKEGQQRYAGAVLAGKKGPISFPVDSIEVKAAWLDFLAHGIPEKDQKKYYTAEYKGRKYGLTSLHIITKDIPNWFWATFHHVDAPKNPFETKDTYGRPSDLNGTVWENYVLGGTQIDFVTPEGKPKILSDHYIEFNFQRSSCITCHATATVSADGSRGPSQPMALCILNGSIPEIGLTAEICRRLVGEHLFRPGEAKLWEELGTPRASWFEKNGKLFYLQTDFVWSIPFRAKNEASPPPKRCLW